MFFQIIIYFIIQTYKIGTKLELAQSNLLNLSIFFKFKKGLLVIPKSNTLN